MVTYFDVCEILEMLSDASVKVFWTAVGVSMHL